MRFNTTGSNNLGLGYYALSTNSEGSNNTALGNEAGYSALGSGNVFIGYQAGRDETGSNKLYISNADDTNLITGDFSAGDLSLVKLLEL